MSRSVRDLLARRIRELRHEKGWSQEDLADACALHRTYIGSLERAERNVGIDVLGALAEAFQISVCELLNVNGTSAWEHAGTSRGARKRKPERPER